MTGGAGMRTIVASVATAAALAALLIGWSLSGWAGVRAEQRALERAARDDGERTARELAAALDARLEELRRSEARRPYYQYQSLYHDPRGAAEGLAVVPSPLASGPEDPLVRAYFQIDDARAVSMPTINDEAPELSDADTLADHRRLRAELARAAAALQVAPDARSEDSRVAMAPARDQVAAATVEQDDLYGGKVKGKPTRYAGTKKKLAPPTKTVVKVDPAVYSQNLNSVDIYKQTRDLPMQQQVQQQVQPVRPAPPRPVEVAIAPPEWRITTIGSEPALALVRRVDTPDGALTQGLVLDREAVVAWLDERAEGRTVGLLTAAPSLDHAAALAARAPLAIGMSWIGVDVRPAVAAASVAAVDVERAFLMRLIPIAALALACGVLVVVLVARAERHAQQRARFAAAAAHELRTPLAGLQLYGDMLADGLGDPGKQRDYARRMAEEASRLGRVVSNVLGFSQLERGNLSVHPAPRDAVALARDALERARPTLERAGVEVVLDAPGGELTALLDEDAALRILGNLLDNAEKYGRGPGTRTVRISVEPQGDRVEIAVVDAGPGVVERQRARLFRPFWRGVAGDGPAGLGLGLALSRSLARAMGGDLLYRPTPGGGATFVLSLAGAR